MSSAVTHTTSPEVRPVQHQHHLLPQDSELQQADLWECGSNWLWGASLGPPGSIIPTCSQRGLDKPQNSAPCSKLQKLHKQAPRFQTLQTCVNQFLSLGFQNTSSLPPPPPATMPLMLKGPVYIDLRWTHCFEDTCVSSHSFQYTSGAEWCDSRSKWGRTDLNPPSGNN